jgi:hypothetical protein
VYIFLFGVLWFNENGWLIESGVDFGNHGIHTDHTQGLLSLEIYDLFSESLEKVAYCIPRFKPMPMVTSKSIEGSIGGLDHYFKLEN